MKKNGKLSKTKVRFIKRKLIQLLVVQALFSLCLGYLLAICQPVDLEKTEVITFTSDSIRYIFGSQIAFEQGDDIYTLSWKAPMDFVVLSDAVAPMIAEEQLTLTVEQGFLTTRKYVVDVRSPSRVYFDIVDYNRHCSFNIGGFKVIGVGFTLLNAVGHLFYVELITGVLGSWRVRRKNNPQIENRQGQW